MSAGVFLTEVEPDGDARETPSRSVALRRRAAARVVGDVAATLLLATLLVWLADHDGGFSRYGMMWAATVALVTAPFLASEVARLPLVGRWVLVGWAVGAVLVVAFAAERTSFAHESLIWATIPLSALAAFRISRRTWGPSALLLLLMLSLGRYWYHTFLTWWGDAMWGRNPSVRPLSWHNQSGMLMGFFALFFAGFALTSRRVLALAGVLVAGACVAGVWLSGSRGSLLATAIGLVAILAIASGDTSRRRVAAGIAGVASVAALVTMALLSMTVDTGHHPVVEREEAAAGNVVARLKHMDAAIGMFADRPLTGHGFGSYRTQAMTFTRPDANLTSSAHNEFAQTLAEGGVVFGVPFWTANAVALMLVWRSLRRRGKRSPPGHDDVLRPVAVAGVGVIVAGTAHAAIDFDWDYPVLPVLLVVAVALVLRDVRGVLAPPRARSWGWSAAAVVPLILLLSVGLGARHAENRANVDRPDLTAEEFARSAVPWDATTNRDNASQLAANGEYDLAVVALDRTIRWNPEVAGLKMVRDTIAMRAGDASPDEVIAAYASRDLGFEVRIYVVRQLVEVDRVDEAGTLLTGIIEDLEQHATWGVQRSLGHAWALRAEIAGRLEGCGGARDVAVRARRAGAVADAAARSVLSAAVQRSCA